MYAFQIYMNGELQPQTLMWEKQQEAENYHSLITLGMENKSQDFVSISDDSGVRITFRPYDVVFIKTLDIKHNSDFNIELKLIEARVNARLQTAVQSDTIINMNKRLQSYRS